MPELLTSGKATVTFSSTGGQALEITAAAGQTINLIAGPTDSDALGRLGITPGVITAAAKKTSSSTVTGTSFGVNALNASSSANSSNANPVYGLGLNSNLDLLSKGDASVAKVSLQNVMNSITNAYQKSNAAPTKGCTIPPSAQSNAPAPAYLTAQIANYSLALQTFSASNSFSTTSSSSGSSIGISSASLMQALA